MAELEIHQEHEVDKDPAGKKVGLLAAVLAVFLAIVTIESHRAHTEGIILKTEANDQWNFYQAKRIKSHSLELGADLISLMAAKGDGLASKKLEEYKSGVARYEKESKEISEQAREKEKEATHAEHKALRFDFGEGLLEIGLVLSSLYFISRRMLFPVIGIVAGLAGIVIAAGGFMVQ
jgi:hypothetical protein